MRINLDKSIPKISKRSSDTFTKDDELPEYIEQQRFDISTRESQQVSS